MYASFVIAAIVVASVIYDGIIGEKPLLFHPTIIFGKIISAYDKKFNLNQKKIYSKISGFLLVVLLCAIVVIFLYFIRIVQHEIANYLILEVFLVVFLIYLLKTTFSISLMEKSVEEILTYIDKKDLKNARKQLSYIVSRPTDKLDFFNVLSAVTECVAESFVDGVFSPFFYFLSFGLYGSLIFRGVNTADSMIGYKTGRYVDFGMPAAKIDDMLNFIPSRLAVGITLLASVFLRYDTKRGVAAYFLYRNKTESPNAGQIMSVYAGILGVRLEKREHYFLGEDIETINSDHARKALKIMKMSSYLWVMICVLIIYFIGLPIIFV